MSHCPSKKSVSPPQPFRAELFSRRPWKRVCISTVFLIWFTYSLLLHGRYYLFFSLFISSAGPITNPMRRKRGELDNTKSLTHVNSTILLSILRDLETAKGSRVNITFFCLSIFKEVGEGGRWWGLKAARYDGQKYVILLWYRLRFYHFSIIYRSVRIPAVHAQMLIVGNTNTEL